ncbi:MAG: hypothetical protein ACYS9T_02200 [Planctomycetota bacterium]
MNRITLIAVLMGVAALGSAAKGSDCVLVNGSFEDDEWISDINKTAPNGWDVNIPDTDKFAGEVDDHWATDPNFSLWVYSLGYATFDANDMATVSQEVYLTDVNEIVFDVNLYIYPPTAWDSSKITPVLLIDDEVVWDMTGSDIRGEYFDVTYVVDEIYQDANPHKFSLGLKVNVSETLEDFYETYWDYIEFNCYCDGYGLISGDIDRDCYVDANDLILLTDEWLSETGEKSKYNLYRVDDPNGIVNFPDYSILSGNWLNSSYD